MLPCNPPLVLAVSLSSAGTKRAKIFLNYISIVPTQPDHFVSGNNNSADNSRPLDLPTSTSETTSRPPRRKFPDAVELKLSAELMH